MTVDGLKDDAVATFPFQECATAVEHNQTCSPSQLARVVQVPQDSDVGVGGGKTRS